MIYVYLNHHHYLSILSIFFSNWYFLFILSHEVVITYCANLFTITIELATINHLTFTGLWFSWLTDTKQPNYRSINQQ